MSLAKLPRWINKSPCSMPNSNNTFSNVYRFCRLLSTSTSRAGKALPPRPKLDDKDITGTYLKGSGPGGQKINKTNSAVQLIHKPTGIVVKSQATRSRSQNQKIAREILAEKVDLLQRGELSRTAIKTALKKKRKSSKAKKSRRKYRELEEEKLKRRMEEMGMGPEAIQKEIAKRRRSAIEYDEIEEEPDGAELANSDVDVQAEEDTQKEVEMGVIVQPRREETP